MFSMEDMKQWRAEKGKHAPLKGNFQVGGSWMEGSEPLSMAATLDGRPQEEVRLMISTASTCHIFDFETFKRGTLHKKYPHMLNYMEYRPNIDKVTIKSLFGGSPMKVHGVAAVPIIINGELYQVFDVYLVDMGPQLQGVFSAQFLADNDLTFDFSETKTQKLVKFPRRQ
ncbi:hypothetical protein BGX33_001938 [Mortierella sp. NVP41]|nr:hypothetical protein BGX33_001938 [Mortierella sp. NVP41]